MFGMRHGVDTLVLCAGEGAPGCRRTNGEFGNIITAGAHIRAPFVSLKPNSRLSGACPDRGGQSERCRNAFCVGDRLIQITVVTGLSWVMHPVELEGWLIHNDVDGLRDYAGHRTDGITNPSMLRHVEFAAEPIGDIWVVGRNRCTDSNQRDG
jgi:hypothetical protein